VYDLNQVSIIVIVLIAFIATVGLENNSKEKIVTEPEVLEVVKAETTEAEVLEVVKTTVDIEDSNKSFFNQYLYYIIGLILLICTFGYMYFRNQKNKSLTEFTNTANAEEKPLEDRVNSQLENESNLRTEQPSEPEVTPEVTEQSSEPEVTPEVTEQSSEPEVTPEVTEQSSEPEVTPEVTEQSSEPEVTPEVTEQSSEPEPIDEENITKDDDNK